MAVWMNHFSWTGQLRLRTMYARSYYENEENDNKARLCGGGDNYHISGRWDRPHFHDALILHFCCSSQAISPLQWKNKIYAYLLLWISWASHSFKKFKHWIFAWKWWKERGEGGATSKTIEILKKCHFNQNAPIFEANVKLNIFFLMTAANTAHDWFICTFSVVTPRSRDNCTTPKPTRWLPRV